MQILIPSNFVPERTYIIALLIKDFLGLEYTINLYDKQYIEIILSNNKKIVFIDDFFCKAHENYLSKNNIPTEVIFSENIFTFEKNIPIIYGLDEVYVKDENTIICGIDIFASSFFMITRWEEIVCTEKDEHQRFKSENSLAQKFNFHQRPVVNEYLEMLWKMLQFIDIKQIRKQHFFQIKPTHDVDFLFLYPNIFSIFKIMSGDILKRKSLKMSFESLKKYLKYKRNNQKDPYNTFEYLMDISEKNNVKSTFYFMPGKLGEKDVKYKFNSPKVKNILEKIQKRGHEIGVHGIYESYNNVLLYQNGINLFKNFGIDVLSTRQHFLRFKNPLTFNILEENKIKYDSTLGYTNCGGFRSGVCFDYQVFDVINRKKLNIIERPLIAMETVIQINTKNVQEFEEQFKNLKNITKKYNGNFTFLWHNSNLNTKLWEKYKYFYERIFEKK